VKVDGATRAGRPKGRCLANSPWLLVLAGMSCAWPVELPGAVADDAGGDDGGAGGVGGVDAAIDLFSPSDRTQFYGSDDCPNPRSIRLVPNTVEMIIALDRSTSMQQHVFDSTTRWLAARQAVEVSTGAHPNIQFGLVQFPSARDCGEQACCADRASLQPYHSTSIDSQLACESGDAGCPVVGSDSPSDMALRRCRESFATEASWQRSSQFVLLITDQDPVCAGDVSTDTTPCGVAIDEASKLGQTLGVQTFLVSLNSDGNSTGCLAKIAAANAANFTGNLEQFVVAPDQQQLGQQIDTIMTSVESNLCRFFLRYAPNNPDQVVVMVNDAPVPYDPSGQQGWSLSDSDTLVLSGSFCTEIAGGQGDDTPIVTDCSP
jgi:hypothetical protein